MPDLNLNIAEDIGRCHNQFVGKLRELNDIGSLSGAIFDGKIPRNVFVLVLAVSLCDMQITHSQKLPMLFYKFINTQILTLNLQNITKCSLNK